MRKFLLLFLLITSICNAQIENSITIKSIPEQASPGETITVVFEYTSATTGGYELQVIPLKDDGQPVWGENKTFNNGAIAVNGAATEVSVSITIPEDITLSADLQSPSVSWGLFGKITDGSADTAYLAPYPTINIVANGNGGSDVTPTGSISIVNFPTEVARGSTIDVTFEYTSNVVGTYELQFIPLNSDGQPVWGSDKAFASDEIAINANATQITISMAIPEDTLLSSELQSPAVAWGLFGKLATSAGDFAYLSPYPQTTVSAVLNTNNVIFDANTLFYNPRNGSLEINTNKIDAKSLQIFNIRGQLVMNIKDASTKSSVDVSFLTSGIYFVRSKNKYLKFVK